MDKSGREQNLQLLENFINLRDAGRGLYEEVFRHIRQKIPNYDDAEDIWFKCK